MWTETNWLKEEKASNEKINQSVLMFGWIMEINVQCLSNKPKTAWRNYGTTVSPMMQCSMGAGWGGMRNIWLHSFNISSKFTTNSHYLTSTVFQLTTNNLIA